jgi:hypothetical protein
MAVKLTCPTCMTSATVDEDEVGSAKCPECDDVLVKPKYKAKNTPDKVRNEDEAEKKPAKKKPKPKAADFDVDDEDVAINPRDGAAAARIGIADGFDDRELVRQVEQELDRGEVLHFACRPSVVIAKWQAIGIGLFGILFAVIGGSFVAVYLAGGLKGMGMFVLIPGVFLLVGVGITVFGAKAKLKQAVRGWYAVTDQRAIVFHASVFGSSGKATTYTPRELRGLRTQNSWFQKGAGDVIFRTEIHETHTTYHNRRTGSSRTEVSRKIIHYGFLGVENVREVESVIAEVLLAGGRDEDDE